MGRRAPGQGRRLGRAEVPQVNECEQCTGLGHLLLAQVEFGGAVQVGMRQCLLCRQDEKYAYALSYAQCHGEAPPDIEMRTWGEPGASIVLLKAHRRRRAGPPILPGPFRGA